MKGLCEPLLEIPILTHDPAARMSSPRAHNTLSSITALRGQGDASVSKRGDPPCNALRGR